MTDLLPFIIAGLATGSLYGLAGIGLVLTYRTSGVLNLGHGAVAAGAAFLFYELNVTHHIAWPIAGIVTLILFSGVVGTALERVTRSLGDAPEALMIVSTVGLFLGIQGLLYVQFGTAIRDFPDVLPTSTFRFGGVNVMWSQVISFLIAAGSAIAMYVFLRRSRLGVAMRAVVDDPNLVDLTGQQAIRVRRAAWNIGCAFAAMSGILLAPTLGLDPYLLVMLVVQAFGACAIGRFTSLPITFLGGLVIGVTASVATRYITSAPWNGLPGSAPFLALVIALLVIPADRFPRRRTTARLLASAPRSISRRIRGLLVLVASTALVVLPFAVGTRLPIWTSGLTYLVLFSSLGLLVWTSGQVSLCHGAFVALGATSMAHLTDAGLPWLPALVGAGLLTVPIGALVAVPAIRLSGVYLALATLGFGVLMQNVVYRTSWMFGTNQTVSAHRPVLGFVDAKNDRWMYAVVLAVAVVCCGLLAAVARSRLGRVLRAMAESPTVLATHGLGVNVTRLLVFCISAFFAGIAGALYITTVGAAAGAPFGPVTSLLLLAVLAISGTGQLSGPIIASLLIAVLPGYVTSFDVSQQTLAFGVIAIAAGVVIAARSSIASWVSMAAASSADRRRNGPVMARARSEPAPAAEQVSV